MPWGDVGATVVSCQEQSAPASAPTAAVRRWRPACSGIPPRAISLLLRRDIHRERPPNQALTARNLRDTREPADSPRVLWSPAQPYMCVVQAVPLKRATSPSDVAGAKSRARAHD